VPGFISEGETIEVDTETGKYVGRSKVRGGAVARFMAFSLACTVLPVLVPQARAQLPGEDVCCVTAEVKTRASPLGPHRLARGVRGEPGRPRVCSSSPDPENMCSQLSDQDRCKKCGYFWPASTV